MTQERCADFWWLPPEIDWQDLVVEVGHSAPLSEKDLWSPDNWSLESGRAGDMLPQWRVRHSNVNVHRKLVVTTPSGEGLFGPVLLDIDHEEGIQVGDQLVYTPDLNVARVVACEAVQRLYANGLNQRDLRIFFSGRKGFHVEIRPASLGATGTLEQQLNRAREWEEGFRSSFELPRNCSIDRIFEKSYLSTRCGVRPYHSFIRLHGSLNCWLDVHGERRCRQKCQVDWQTLRTSSIKELCRLAEYAVVEGPEL